MTTSSCCTLRSSVVQSKLRPHTQLTELQPSPLVSWRPQLGQGTTSSEVAREAWYASQL